MAGYSAQEAEKRERSRGGRRKRRRMRLQSPIMRQPEGGSARGSASFIKEGHLPKKSIKEMHLPKKSARRMAGAVRWHV